MSASVDGFVITSYSIHYTKLYEIAQLQNYEYKAKRYEDVSAQLGEIILEANQRAADTVAQAQEQAGSSLDRVVKCTVFLKNIDDYAEMNAVYATYFPEQPPARSTVAGSGLARAPGAVGRARRGLGVVHRRRVRNNFV